MSRKLLYVILALITFVSIDYILMAEPVALDPDTAQINDLSPFVENKGQVDPSILFYSDNEWGRLCVRDSDMVFQLLGGKSGKTVSIKNVYLRFDSNSPLTVEGGSAPVSHLSYFIGSDSLKWHTGVPVYDSLKIKNFIQNGEVSLSSSKSGKAFISGVEKEEFFERVQVDSNAQLSILNGILSLRSEGVNFAFDLFACDRKDNHRIESQSLSWATYLGGRKDDAVYQVVSDPEKNIYIAGDTYSSDIPVPNGYDQTYNSGSLCDIYVAKISPDGSSLLWGTYIGGEGQDSAFTLGIDPSGNVVVGGMGYKDIPTPGGNAIPSSNGGGHIYLAKLSPDGSSLLWATAVWEGQLSRLVLTHEGDIAFVGVVEVDGAPCPNGFDTTRNGYDDLYIAKFTSNGSIIWGTYLGGSGYDGFRYHTNYVSFSAVKGPCIDIFPDGNLVVATSTNSSNIPIVNGYSSSKRGERDLYVAKISSDGSGIIGSTYLGGTSEELISGLKCDSSGNLIVSGTTRSHDMPVKNAFQPARSDNSEYEGYIARVSSDCSALQWATYLGGSADDCLFDIDRDSNGNVLFTGRTHSDDFPVINPYQVSRRGFAEIFFGLLKSDGTALLESSYLGGTGSDDGYTVIFDNLDSMIFAGRSSSHDIPVAGGFDGSYNGGIDIYLAKFDLSSVVGCSLSCSATVPQFAKPNESVSFTGSSTVDPAGCTTPVYDWDFGDGAAHSSAQNAGHTYTAEGTYAWEFTVSGSGVAACKKSGSIIITNSSCRLTCEASSPPSGLINAAAGFTASSTATDCTQGVSYLWEFGDGQTSTLQNPLHTYTTAGTYTWTLTASADSFDCVKTGTIEILAERPCLTVGYIEFCADSITQDGSKYTLAGNVAANGSLLFSNSVEYYKQSSNILTNGTVYVPNVHGVDETIVEGANIEYFVDGSDGSMTPVSVPPQYSLSLANLPLEISGTSIVLDPGGVIISPFINLGVEPLIIARVQSEILVVPNGDKTLISMEVIAGDLVPSISIASFSVTYETETDTITGEASLGLPFLEVASLSASVEFVPGCLNGFSITMGLPAGIPLGPSGLELDGLTLEVDNICSPAQFYIFLGGDIAIEGVPSEVLVLQHLGLGYQVPFTLEIDGGSLAFLGYPLSGMGGSVTVYPPYVSVNGDTNIAGIYTTHVSVTLDVSNLLISGSAYGSLQIPDWNCCYTCLLCKCIRATVRRILGGLPHTFAGAGMDVSLGQVEEGEWGGDLRGMVTVANHSIAADISFLNGDISLFVGRNYDNLYEIWLRQERALSPLGYEKTVSLPQDQELVTFCASGESVMPEIYLVTPTGERLTKDNYTTYPGVAFIESPQDQTSFFEVTPVAAGDWTFGMTNLNQGEGDLFALGIRQMPVLTFESVTPDSNGYEINLKVSPASEETKVSLFYSDSPNFGEGYLIAKELTSDTGSYSANWDTKEVPNGKYMIFAKADDAKNPPEALYHSSQVTVNRDAIQPPTSLTGTMLQDGAHLGWVPSSSADIAGYDVLYTDEPDVLGYKYKRHSAYDNSAVITGLDSAKTYRFAVAAFDGQAVFSLESNTVTLAYRPPPVISSMMKLGNPFRIKVNGSNLQQGIQVYINDTLWTNTKWKSAGNIKIKGGSSLKALVPKGVDAQFKFVNPDGGETTITWKY